MIFKDLLRDSNAQVVADKESAQEEGGTGPHREVVREEHRGGRVVEGAVPGGPRGGRVAGVGGVQDDGHRVCRSQGLQ